MPYLHELFASLQFPAFPLLLDEELVGQIVDPETVGLRCERLPVTSMKRSSKKAKDSPVLLAHHAIDLVLIEAFLCEEFFIVLEVQEAHRAT